MALDLGGEHGGEQSAPQLGAAPTQSQTRIHVTAGKEAGPESY
jgi:hypothetical protein